MKRIKILSMAAGLFFAQAAIAQHPAMSTQYSNEEIAQMIGAYKTAHSHDVVPPASLQQKFQADFPKAYDVEWETASDIYEVEFDVRFRDFKAFYDPKGNLLMVVEEIRPSDLPAVVKNAAESKYPKYAFEDIEKIQCGSAIFYNIEMERSEAEAKLSVNSDGTVTEAHIEY